MQKPLENYTIRPARAEELAALRDIEDDASTLFAGTPYAFLIEAEPTALGTLAQQQSKGMLWVAADSEDRPVGFALALIIDGQAHLHELDVHPAHGQRGLGKRLIDTLCDWARRTGYRSLTLSTFRDIAWNAPFYARLGFTILREDELGPELREIRAREATAGLPIEDRVCMRLML